MITLEPAMLVWITQRPVKQAMITMRVHSIHYCSTPHEVVRFAELLSIRESRRVSLRDSARARARERERDVRLAT